MRRRLLIGLLLVVALAGGLWWNSTRLNETERKLVGVWELTDLRSAEALFLLPNHRACYVRLIESDWVIGPQDYRWDASPSAVRFRALVPAPSIPPVEGWWNHLATRWKYATASEYEITTLTDDRFGFSAGVDRANHRRSTNPKLSRMFDRLSAGESPY